MSHGGIATQKMFIKNMPKLYAFLVHKLLQKHINVNVAKTIYALFWPICRINDLRAPSGKFLRIKICHPESLDFLGLWLEMEPLVTGAIMKG